MDDLSGLNWTSTTSQDANRKPVMNSGALFSTLRPTPPISGRSTPLSAQPSGARAPPSNPSSKPATPANDSFSNLVSFGANSSDKNLSLAERQKRLAEQKAYQEAAKRKLAASQYENKDSSFWENLGSGNKGTPAQGLAPYAAPTIQAPSAVRTAGEWTTLPDQEEEDLLAAFNSSAPVDASSHFPFPQSSKPTSPKPRQQTRGAIKTPPMRNGEGRSLGSVMGDDDNDPFGLGEMKPTKAPPTRAEATDEDDFLGLLGRPVSDLTPPKPTEARRASPSEAGNQLHANTDPHDRAIAELVDMGFSAEKAQQALATTDSGADIQAAVGWLLNQAHSESRQKSQSRDVSGSSSRVEQPETRVPRQPERPQRNQSKDSAPMPAWMRPERESGPATRREDSRSPANGERDPARIAAEIGNNLYSFWKVGTKKMQQAVQEFNSDSDSSQPKWMREPSTGENRAAESRPPQDEGRPRRRRSSTGKQKPTFAGKQVEATDEALMLDAPRSRPPPRKPAHERRDPRTMQDAESSRDSSPSIAPRAFPKPVQQTSQTRQDRQPYMEPKSRLTRQTVEDESSQAYVSSARRRNAAPRPPPAETEPDLIFNDSSAANPPSRPLATSHLSQPTRPSRQSAPPTIRPKAPQRHIPSVSPFALSQSHSHRQKGTEAYKRGDYATAHSSYSSALAPLPQKHPINIIILTNRAMTGLKVGEPKASVADADLAISLIGPSKGEAETINLENNEAPKDMKEIYGKALMRKAEALEQMERWEEAAKVWREAVELGHGGSTSIAARNRCEKAGGTNQPARAVAALKKLPKKAAPPKKSALDELSERQTSVNAQSAEAVTRLREANAAADRVDDEKFALADKVDAKLTAWKGGKQDNLRALLGSLDTVLWPEAGWKKVGMAELVLPGKVKIAYMKGIAKVHPDKLLTTATTEQKMISGAVFSTLNEAWDKFKRENGM